MTKITTLGVKTVTRPAAANAAAPAVVQLVAPGEKGGGPVAKDPVPAASLIAQPALAALIAVQAGDSGHADPQPDHGRDDEHGHAPAPQPTPDPAPTPPPVVQPPVVQPTAPHVAFDPTLPARTIAMVAGVLADGRVAEAERSAAAAAAAQRRAAVTVAQGQAALAILSAMRADMAAARAQALGRYAATSRLA